MREIAKRTISKSAGLAPRILIARLSAIGDCIQTLPVASALRRQFPDAFIAWAVEAGAAPLIAAHPAVDQVIELPKGILTSPTAAWRVRQQLLPLDVEIALDPQGLSKSSAVAWLSGARRRIGFARPAGREISSLLNGELVEPRKTHMVDRYLELLEPLGIEQPAVEFGLDRLRHASAIETFAAGPEIRAGFAVVNPGAGWDSKRWPIERLAELVRQLGERASLPSVVLWGGARELAWAEQIVHHSAGHGRLAPPTTLLELAGLLKRANLMIAADTGPLHLAAAVGTPSVGLFGATRREICGPYGGRHIALQAAFDGSAGRKLPGADNWAMRRISVSAVFAACQEILGVAPAGRSRALAALPCNR
ncbi:MAG: glycosyltransferase family 9 protein [Pirellulaceae bacterium]